MKKNVGAVFGMVACAVGTPDPGINQPPLTIKITPDSVKDVTRTAIADDLTPTTIEPTEPVTSDVFPTVPPAQSTFGSSMVETIAPIESVKVAVYDASPLGRRNR